MSGGAMYRCVAQSVEGFLQQLAVGYVTHGHWFYVQGEIPEGKNPEAIDTKLLERYDIDISRSERSRRKKAGRASVQYLRHGSHFILVATHGQHRFFEEEANAMRDCRRVPIHWCGHSVSHRGGHVSVRIELREYRQLKAHFLELACHRRVDGLIDEFGGLRYVRFAPVRQQLLSIWRAVNQARKASRLRPVPVEALKLKRQIYQPFVDSWSSKSSSG